jgi:hypothetical protein
VKTCRCVAALLVPLTLCVASAASLRAQVYTFDVIADTKSGAFTDLGLFPSINSAGVVSFRAEAPGGPGIFTGGNGAPAAVANATNFTAFGVLDPKINDAGRVAFFGVQPAGASGIFASTGGTLEKIAGSGESFAPNETFRAFGAPSLNNNGLVSFTAASSARNLGTFVGRSASVSRQAITSRLAAKVTSTPMAMSLSSDRRMAA